ncbi:hypothetical protein M409DRAFT_57738 [Zasmidium cellare ATCC 36951]|uniref:NADP-dependent oxidoreductase domain-containing protein n=1 Tax=Zasmidium cellare ATCC 36951 TaxID=1080233 RepID=A0A6A6CAX7_ZASCE|nr:uncharacterized protein M409DRAFT_57738 [Zasmidium cellare ATCC 36951]KAF2163062.1 hypothetical protein M409DRAFT_57738 [Zasmidium cellare ATCC 36951]
MSSEELPTMQYRLLGRTGLKVSCISLGGWLTYGTAGGGHVDDEKSFECMKAAHDAGINFFDCAEGYAGGESERVMGKCIQHYGWKRNDIVVSTKINWGQTNGDNPINNTGLSRKHIIESTEASLERLGLEYVDVLYAHRPDRDTPMAEVVRAFNFLIDHGKCFYWGTSEWNADEIERAHRIADTLHLVGPVVEQPQYNMLCRQRVEAEYSLLYEVHGLGLTPYSPLKAGILTGKYIDGIPADSRFARSNDSFVQGMQARFQTPEWERESKAVIALSKIAGQLGTDLPKLAMAWVLRNKNVASAITGASKPEQVWESVKSIRLLDRLTDTVMQEIEEVLDNKPLELTRRF